MSAETLTPRPLPRLNRAEGVIAAGTAVLAASLGLVGFAGSFEAVSQYAHDHGFPHDSWLVPAGIDTGVLVFSIANVLLIRLGMGAGWVKWMPWALTAVTIYLNVTTGTDAFARVAHAALPALWVAMSAIAEHAYRRYANLLTNRHMDRVRVSRWLLAPLPTLRLWRRMILWEIVDYRDALNRERERLAYVMRLRESHGRRWRRVAPVADRIRVRFDLTPESVTAESDTDSATESAPESGPVEASQHETPEPSQTAELITPRDSEFAQVIASLPPVNGTPRAPRPRVAAATSPARRQASVTARVGVDRDSVTQAYRESVEQGDPLSSRALARRFEVSQSTAARIIADARAEDSAA